MNLVLPPLRVGLAALVGLSLTAGDSTFGLQVGALLPLRSLKTFTSGGPGVSGGLHLQLDLGDGWALRPRIDLATLPGKEGHYRFQQRSAGVDVLFFAAGLRAPGPYLALGLGAARNRYQARFAPASDAAATKPYLGVAGGYQFSQRFGAELRYTTSRFKDAEGQSSAVNALALTGTVHF